MRRFATTARSVKVARDRPTRRTRTADAPAPPTKRKGKSVDDLRKLGESFVGGMQLYRADTVLVADCSAGGPVTVRSRALLQALLLRKAAEGALSANKLVAIVFAPQDGHARLRVVCGNCGHADERAAGLHSVLGRFVVTPTQITEPEDARLALVTALLSRVSPAKRLVVFGSDPFVQHLTDHCNKWKCCMRLEQATDNDLHIVARRVVDDDGDGETEECTLSAADTAQKRVETWLSRAVKEGRGLPTAESALCNAIGPLCTVQTCVGHGAAKAVVERLVAANIVSFCVTCECPTFAERSALSSSGDEDPAMQRTLAWLRGHKSFADMHNIRSLRTHIAHLLLTEHVSPQSVVDRLTSSTILVPDTDGKLHVAKELLASREAQQQQQQQQQPATTSVTSRGTTAPPAPAAEPMQAANPITEDSIERSLIADSFDKMWLSRDIAAAIVQHGFRTPTALQREVLASVIHGLHSKTHCLVVGGPRSGKTTIAVAAACNGVLAKSKFCQGLLLVSDDRKAVEALALARSFTRNLGTECLLAKNVGRGSGPQLVVGTCRDIDWMIAHVSVHVVLRVLVIDDAEKVFASEANQTALRAIVSRVFGQTNSPQIVVTSTTEDVTDSLELFPISDITLLY